MTTVGDQLFQFGGVPVGLGANVPFTTGRYFFVDNTTGNNSNSGKSIGAAVATIDNAIGKCTASKSDVIVCLPGHTETLSAAGQLVCDVLGIAIVGLGWGTLRPKISFTDAASDIDITAASVMWQNIVFSANVADVLGCIDSDAADTWFNFCEWEQNGADLNWVDVIVGGADNVSDGLKITNCRSISIDTSNDGFLNCVGDIDRLVMTRNHIAVGVSGTEPIVEVTGKSLTNCLVTYNHFERENTSGITCIDSDQTDNSGTIAYNTVFSLDSDAATPFDVTGCGLFENYALGAVDGSGLLLPAVDDNA